MTSGLHRIPFSAHTSLHGGQTEQKKKANFKLSISINSTTIKTTHTTHLLNQCVASRVHAFECAVLDFYSSRCKCDWPQPNASVRPCIHTLPGKKFTKNESRRLVERQTTSFKLSLFRST